MALAVGADLGGNLGVQLLRAGEAQGAVYKVVLIVNDKQIPVHRRTSTNLILQTYQNCKKKSTKHCKKRRNLLK